MYRYLLLAAALALPCFAAGELSGRRAPGFALVDLNLNYHDLLDHRGQVVIVDIMKTDCPHCAAVAKNLERIKAKFGNRIAILSIVTPPDTQATVKGFLNTHKITTPVLFDCGQVAASYMKLDFKRPSFDIPHVFLIDGQGMIRNDIGYSQQNESLLTGDGLAAEVEKLLNARPAAAPKKAVK
jgi:peroxiredoxin